MRAAVIGRDGDEGPAGGAHLQVGTADDPVPGPTDVVLRVGACGVCGSDLTAVEYLPSGYVMGHELAGEVVDVGGAEAGGWRAGDLVCALPVVGCGRCDRCLAGEAHHCREGPDLVGVGGRAGAYAEYVRVDGRQAFRLPEGVDARRGALAEPLAVALHAVDAAALRPGDHVLVIGGGPIGVAVAVAARAAGGGEVVVSEPAASRRAVAELAGATATVDPGSEDVAEAFAALVGGPPDVVVEAVGKPGMLQHAVDLSGPHGRVVVAGVCAAPDTVVPYTAVMKELTVRFVVYYRRRDFPTALAMLARGPFDPGAMVTGAVGLDDLPGRFDALRAGGPALSDCKVLLTP